MRAYQLRPLAAKRCRKGDGSASSPAPAGKALGQPDRAICRARKHAPAPDVIAPPSNPAPTARRPACKFEQLWVTLCGIGALRIGKKLLRYNSLKSQNVRPVHFGEILPAYERTADTITCGSGTDSGEAPGPLRLDLTAPGPPRRAGSGVGGPQPGLMAAAYGPVLAPLRGAPCSQRKPLWRPKPWRHKGQCIPPWNSPSLTIRSIDATPLKQCVCQYFGLICPRARTGIARPNLSGSCYDLFVKILRIRLSKDNVRQKTE